MKFSSYRDLAFSRLGRDENRELHVAVIGLGRMAVETHPAAEAVRFVESLYLHRPLPRYS